MWEVFTCGEMPYGKKKNAEVIDDICHQNLRLQRPWRCPEPVYELMLTCWLAVCYLHLLSLVLSISYVNEKLC